MGFSKKKIWRAGVARWTPNPFLSSRLKMEKEERLAKMTKEERDAYEKMMEETAEWLNNYLESKNKVL